MKIMRFFLFFVFFCLLSLLLCSCLPEDKPLTDKNNIHKSEIEGRWIGTQPIDPWTLDSKAPKQQVTIVNYGDYYCFLHTNRGIKKFILTKLGDAYFISIKESFVHKDSSKYYIFRITISPDEIALWALSSGVRTSLHNFEKNNGFLSQKELCDWCKENVSCFSEKTEYCYKKLNDLSSQDIQKKKDTINIFFDGIIQKKKEFNRLLQQAKEGDADSQYRIAKYYEKECHNILEKEDVNFINKWLILSAKSGNKLAAFELSRRGISEKAYKDEMAHEDSNVIVNTSPKFLTRTARDDSDNICTNSFKPCSEKNFWKEHYGFIVFAALILGFTVFVYEICSVKNDGKGGHVRVLLICVIAVITCGFIQETIYWPTCYNPASIGRLVGAWLGTSLIAGVFFWITIILCILALILCKNRNKQYRKSIIEKERECAKIKALEELQNGNTDKQTWANALIAAEGDETKAKAEYLKLRKF